MQNSISYTVVLTAARPSLNLCQALAQCDGYIRKLGLTCGAVDDTATAAHQVSLLTLACQ